MHEQLYADRTRMSQYSWRCTCYDPHLSAHLSRHRVQEAGWNIQHSAKKRIVALWHCFGPARGHCGTLAVAPKEALLNLGHWNYPRKTALMVMSHTNAIEAHVGRAFARLQAVLSTLWRGVHTGASQFNLSLESVLILIQDGKNCFYYAIGLG